MISQTPIFTIHAELGDIRHFGQTPYGERRVIDILGGRIAMGSRPITAPAFSSPATDCVTARPT
jgi:hypothetical protein